MIPSPESIETNIWKQIVSKHLATNGYLAWRDIELLRMASTFLVQEKIIKLGEITVHVKYGDK